MSDPDGNEHAHRLDRETVTALQVELASLPGWRLSGERWHEVREILTRLTDGLAEGNREAVRTAAVELALSGPVRITRIGAGHMPPTAEVMERRAELEHVLVGPDTGDADEDER